MSEPAVSSETTKRRMSSDISGPLNDMPDGATLNAQVANTCLLAGEYPNKTPIFLSGVRDSLAFLAWLRASCPVGLTAQLKSEKLMLVPSSADGFRAAVSALRSLDGREGVSFHTFTLPEDRCVRLLVKKTLGRGTPESVVREKMESLNIRVQGVTQLRSSRRDQDPTKDRPPNPTSLYPWREVPRCRKYDLSPNSAACECRWNLTWHRKAHCNKSAASALDTHSETAVTHPGASRVGAPTSPVVALTRGNSPNAVAARETTRRTTGAVRSGKRRRSHLQSRRPTVAERAPPQPTLPLRKNSRPGPLASRWTWARSGITSFEGACYQGHYPTKPYSKSPFPAGHESFRKA